MPPRMVLVGLGVDNTTERMVDYLSKGGSNISLLTFYAFVQEGRTLFARNVEVYRTDTTVGTLRKSRAYNRRENFEARAQSLPPDIRDIISAAQNMFKTRLRGVSQTYANNWINFNLDYSWYKESDLSRVATVFVAIDAAKKCVTIGFHPIAIHLTSAKEFEITGIQFETAEPRVIIRMGIDHEVRFPMYSLEEWDAPKDTLTALTKKVCEAYDNAREEALSRQ